MKRMGRYVTVSGEIREYENHYTLKDLQHRKKHLCGTIMKKIKFQRKGAGNGNINIGWACELCNVMFIYGKYKTFKIEE